ncbi:spore coat polysaccharide biosynthesis protein SpsK [Nitrospirota bacterium]|nr:spore coat polysaccharide biosynthesis protein SpsK [Nitrospirota bacterium]GDX89487.1 NAD(P)-dependent oxidoreductase [Nitrospirota bacterium]
MRILITGAQGQLGQALQQALVGDDLILKDLPEFDLTQADCESQIVAAGPSVILHAGAYTNVDGAERAPDRAMAVNVQGTTFVARAAATLNARLIYLSTDYVFDGRQTTPYREEDVPHPINVYGQSKRDGELAALAGCPNTLVARTAWLYGQGGSNFVKTMMKLAREKPFLEVVGDQRGCPTNADDLAVALKDLIASDLRGICHVTNRGDCTWHEFAEAIVSLMGLAIPVRSITTEQMGRHAKRPPYSVLAPGRLSRVRALLPHWNDSLARFMKETPRLASC